MLISIIIPALNEAKCIATTLLSLQSQTAPFEVLVVDGGSSDDTVARASPYARVIASDKGRARQMNAGAQEAEGEVYLFLHADTLLPRKALESVRTAILQDGAESGSFRLQFDADSTLLRFYSYCTRFNQPKICFGDRALFVKREVFDEIGGFKHIPIFEDLEIVDRLYQRGTFTFLSDYVTTAARRFEEKGPLLQQLLNSYLWMRYMMGASPHQLARHYKYTPSRTLDSSSTTH